MNGMNLDPYKRRTNSPLILHTLLSIMEVDSSIDRKRLKLPPMAAGGSLIDGLPDECLNHIFGFLVDSGDRCNCALISKKWLHLMATLPPSDVKMPEDSRPPELISRRLTGKKASDIRLAALAVRSFPQRALKSLCIMGDLHLLPSSSSLTDYGLAIIAKASPSLKSLSLWHCGSIGDAGFKALGRWCRGLERLDLIRMPLVTDNGMSSIASSCVNLSDLSIVSCPLIGNGAFEIIANKSLKLRAMTLIKCPLVSDSGIISVVSSLPELTRLQISVMQIGDEVLKAIADCAKALRVLHLDRIEGTSQTGYYWVGAMEELKLLKLRLCAGLTGDSFRATRLTGLKEIHVGQCRLLTDEVLIELSRSAKQLKRLRLEECGVLGSNGLLEALKNWKETLKLLSFNKCSINNVSKITGPAYPLPYDDYPDLTTLELKQCDGVGDVLLYWIALACNQAREVSLVGMNTFTDGGLLRLLYANNLTSLDLTGCRTISDQALCNIIRFWGEGLRCLKLGFCSGVNDGVTAHIAAYGVALEELYLDGCGITDTSAWCIGHMDKDKLQSLSLARCAGITDKSLKFLEEMTWCTLKMLNIRNCPSISRQSIEALVDSIWWCKVMF